jgi:acyl-CoA synthetase (AMP-forming)/AMP-acid ligase II
MHDPGHADLTLLDALRRHAHGRPDAIAYRWGARQWTFRDLDRDTSRLAHALVRAGIGPGDRLATLTKHHVPCLLLTLAALKLGAVCMPVNWRLAPAEAHYILHHGQARLLLVDAAFAAPFAAGGGVDLPAGCTLLCTEQALAGAPAFEPWFAAQPDQFDAVAAGTDDAALQLYSSGTTGLPKGVVLSHRGLLSTSRVVSQGWHFGADGVLGNPLPTFHIAGMTMLLLSLYTGGTTIAYSDFDAAGFIASIGRDQVSHAFLVPAMLLFMVQSPAAAGGNYRSLRLIAYGGSPISETLLTQAMAVFGCDFLQVYGLTEVSGPGTFLMPEDHRRALQQQPRLLRSAGRPAEPCAMRIADPATGAAVPDGQTGEVWLETVRNFTGYWRDEAATAAAFPEGRNARGGWFRTGDAGFIEDGYLYINDRIKDMIVSGGENIYPAEIENLLMKHPAVADGAIIGVPDATWGEAVKACVVLRPGTSATERELIDWLRGQMAHFKCPKTVDFVDTLPRNPSGKLLKRVLRAPYWEGQQRGVA